MMNLTERAQIVLGDIKETMILIDQAIDLAANDRKKELEEITQTLEEIGKRIMISLPNLTNEIQKLDVIEDELNVILEEIGRMLIRTYEDYEGKKYDPNKNKEMLKEVEEEEAPYVEACMFLMEYAYNKR